MVSAPVGNVTACLSLDEDEGRALTEYFVRLPMFAEDRWPEGIYRDESEARRVASVGNRQLYVRDGPDEEWKEIDL